MPPFILQEYKHPLGRPPQRIIFTKNEYCKEVKMPDWDRIKECDPKDYDAYDPPGGSQFKSTYNRIGHEKEENHFATTTGLDYNENKEKKFIKPDRKPLIHYLTYKDKCRPRKHRRCPVSEDCAPEFLSTMHDSYKIPLPCVLQPLSYPKIPFLQNRKLKWEEEEIDVNKFFDDCCKQNISTLQAIKGLRSKSYNPITQKYTDGSSIETVKRKCIELPFNHVS